MRSLALFVMGAALVGCGSNPSTTPILPGGGNSGGDAAATATGGGNSSGNTNGGTTTGYDGGSSTGGDAGSSTGGDGGSSTGSQSCGDNILQAKPIPADILIVFDRSSSMAGINSGAVDRWTPSTMALEGVVDQFDQTVRFGLMLFPSKGQLCDQGSYDVPLEDKAGGDITMALGQSSPAGGLSFTPTDQALQHALKVIEGRKPMMSTDGEFQTSILPQPYVLLVTDGVPSCDASGALDVPDQSMVDGANKAIEDLAKNGVKTYVIGYDVAQSGADIMNGFAQRGGTGSYIAVDSGDALDKALRDITANSVPCQFALPGTPSPGATITVNIDGNAVDPSPDNGWSIDGSVVTLNGKSCDSVHDGTDHNVEVDVPCKDIMIY